MYTQPATPPSGRLIHIGDTDTLVLLPEDGLRLEYVWGETGEALPIDQPFSFEVSTSIEESTVPTGHEWCAWQVHPADDPELSGANPIIALIVKDGVQRVDVFYEFSQPYDHANKTQLTIASMPVEIGRMSKWQVKGCFGQAGWITVRRDGLLVADYAGPLGYHMTGHPYRKAGIYKWDRNWRGRIVARVKP